SLAGEPGAVHGVNVGIENHGVEVPDQNRQSGQNGLVIVQGGGRVGKPLRKIAQREIVEPKSEAGGGHHRRAPQECQIFYFLDVVKFAEGGAFVRQAQVVQEHLGKSACVRQVRNHVAENGAIAADEDQ